MGTGERIRLIIKQKCKTHKEFAEKISISPHYVTQLVNESRNPGSEVVAKLIEEFGINANWLLTGEGEMYVKPSQPETPPEMNSRITELEHQIIKMQKEIEDLRYISNLQARLIDSYERQLGINNGVENEGKKGNIPAVSLSVENAEKSLIIRHKKGGGDDESLNFYYAFIRPKEALHLQVKSIDLVNRQIRISGCFSKTNAHRSVFIPRPLYEHLLTLELHNRNPNDRLFQFRDIVDVRNNYYKLINDFGLPYYSIYRFKHSGVCEAYKIGLGIIEIKDQCGHTTIETTYRYLRGLGASGGSRFGVWA